MTVTADWHITNAKVLDVFNQKFVETDLWVTGDKIVLLGTPVAGVATQTYDAQGQYVIPGLIDAHMHVESTTLAPTTLASVFMDHGITRAFIDPHEIASVAGAPAIQYMLDEAGRTPFHYHVMLPSSVPATNFERTGAALHAADLKPFYDHPDVGGLAEVMDYPAVANADPDMMQKIADALAAHKTVDGHGAGLTPEQIADYRNVGIDTDHEAVNAQEAAERAALGMHILIREGTVEQDELAILPAINAQNQRQFSFATDDKTAVDIAENGGVDHSVRVAMNAGMAPELALTMATLNAAEAHHLTNVGALTAGYVADLVVVEDLKTLEPTRTMVSGEWIDEHEPVQPRPFATNLMNVSLTEADLALPLKTGRAHVIDVKPFHIDTEHSVVDVPMNGDHEFLPNAEFAKITVAERYHDLGNGVGIIRGLGIREGAVGTTFSNDSHNVVIAGASDEAIVQAADALREIGGGMVVVDGQGDVTALPLEIGGLMTTASVETTVAKTRELHAKISQLCNVDFDVFQTLSFMALPVIPSLKITDQGLFDFDTWSFIGIDAE